MRKLMDRAAGDALIRHYRQHEHLFTKTDAKDRHVAAAALAAHSREELFDALQGELTDSHRLVLDELMQHIEDIENRIVRFDLRLLAGLEIERNLLALLQTLPGIDLIGAAMLLVEIGTDMDAFGSADRLASWVGICPGNNESAV